MADADISAQSPLSKKSLMQSGLVEEPLDILYASHNRQPSRLQRGITHRHPILRTQIHAGHIDDVKRTVGMLLVVPLNGLLQLRQNAQVRIALQLLLALAAGEDELSLPWRWISFGLVCHSDRLDAGFL